MSKPQILTPIAALAAIIVLVGFAFAGSGAPTTVSAQVPSATPTTNHGPIDGLVPGHNCYGSTTLRYLPVGGSATCIIRVNNHADVTADDVTARFSNTNLTVSDVAIRVGPSGPFPQGITTPGATTLQSIAPATDVPADSGLYIRFTVTRDNATQGAPRYPIVCADASNLPEVCSQGGAY